MRRRRPRAAVRTLDVGHAGRVEGVGERGAGGPGRVVISVEYGGGEAGEEEEEGGWAQEEGGAGFGMGGG